MSLPKRDGINDRYYLIHKPDASPEVLAEADLCIQDMLNGTARENHSDYLTVVRNHNGTPFLPDQLLERYLTGLLLKKFPCEDAVSVCDAMRRLVCDYLDRCDDEHSSLQEKFIHALFKKFGFTAPSLPVLVHGVQSMQNLKPAKEFRTLIANEESLDALLEIKEHLEYYLPEESGSNKRALAYLWHDVLWAIWGTASENGGSKVIKTAPKELKEKYRQVFA